MRALRAFLGAGIALLLGASPALAAIVYNSDDPSTGFDATTNNTLPSGWVNSASPAGNWQASTTPGRITSHTKSFWDAGTTGESAAILTSMTASADMEITLTQVITSADTSQFNTISPWVRTNAAGTNAYALVCLQSSGSIKCQIYKVVSSVFTALGTLNTVATIPAFPFTLQMRFSIVGTTVSGKGWVDGTAEPSSWTAQVTDSSVTGTGYAALGFQNSRGAAASWNGATDVVVNDTPSGGTTSILQRAPASATGGSTTVSGTYTGTAPSGFDYAYDAGSWTSVSSPTISAGNFSFPLPNTTTDYHQLSIRSAGATTITSATPAFSITAGVSQQPPFIQMIGLLDHREEFR